MGKVKPMAITWPSVSVFFFKVNKQINDKERVAAAMENPNLLELIDTCIDER